MELEDIIVSEISQRKTSATYLTYMWNLKQQDLTDTENRPTDWWFVKDGAGRLSQGTDLQL